MMTIGEIKNKGKESLLKTWGKQVGISALCVIQLFIPLIGAASIYSVTEMCYKVSQGENIELKDCVSGIKKRFGASLLAAMLKFFYVLLLLFVLAIPTVILAARFAWPQWLVFIVSAACIVIALILEFGYAMAYYIMVREPDIDGHKALTKSREMMVGHKLKFFLLQLSFIGWDLLCVLFFPAVFVHPYVFNSITIFFNDVYDSYQNKDIIIKDKSIKYCRFCGQAISASSTFCPNCGNNLEHK